MIDVETEAQRGYAAHPTSQSGITGTRRGTTHRAIIIIVAAAVWLLFYLLREQI